MKTRRLLTIALALSAFTALQAADNLLTNGDFEAAPTEEEVYSFSLTPEWYNRADNGKRQDIIARSRKDNQGDSAYTASVNDNQTPNSIFSQRTKHVIKAGEVYQVSLDWRPSFRWRAGDLVRVKVFATLNDKLGGAVVWEDSADFENSDGQSWNKAEHTFQPAHPDAEGKLLYFNFQGVGNMEALDKRDVGFARVDNIVLTVTP